MFPFIKTPYKIITLIIQYFNTKFNTKSAKYFAFYKTLWYTVTEVKELIQILLATYNGEKYIKTQLESLFNQTYTDFEILVSDDGSSDRTIEIIADFQKEHPDKLRFIPDKTPSGGAKNNFFKLMGYADADYIMFCDQDDYWLPEKIELTLKKMKETEKECIPTLVHTDLSVSDQNLNVLHKSFFKMQHFERNMKLNLGKSIAQNTVTGCTVMINRPLLELARHDNHESIIMHDWWLTVLAATFGKVGVLKQPTILYRQHGNNSVGAKTFSQSFQLYLRKEKSISSSLDISYEQAAYFLNKYEDKLSAKQKYALQAYCNISSSHEFQRLYVMLRYSFLKQSFMHKSVQIAHCLLCACKHFIKNILKKQ